jgi:hypothetical protein
MRIRFLRSRSFDFLSRFDGETLCMHYAAREPVPTSDGDTTQLPMGYFGYAAYLYAQRRLMATPDMLPSVLSAMQTSAQAALASISATKPEFRHGIIFGK